MRREAAFLQRDDSATAGLRREKQRPSRPPPRNRLIVSFDANLPEVWTSGPFATGEWKAASLDGKCIFKVALGATRDSLALRWESCGSGCLRSLTDWATKGYRLAAARRPVDHDVAEALSWGRVYPGETTSPAYVVAMTQPLTGATVSAAIGLAITGDYCTINLRSDGVGTTYLAEHEPVLTGAKGMPLGRVDATGLTQVSYFAYRDLSSGATAEHVASSLSDGFLHVQTEPTGLAVIRLVDGFVVTKSLVMPLVELPRKVAGGTIGRAYGGGALWFVGNDGTSAKIYTTTPPSTVQWFDVDRSRGDTLVWAEQADGGVFSLWEAPLVKTTAGAKPRKLHSQATSYGAFVANAGAILSIGEAPGQLRVVRAADSATETLVAPATDRPLEPVWLDEKELWFTTEPSTTIPAGSARSWIVRLGR
ncbi:MAG: hypothetical protein JNL79_06660 [Myxococcales bacterium]|nr:hypothetical protein [Myxococcales bacterium]